MPAARLYSRTASFLALLAGLGGTTALAAAPPADDQWHGKPLAEWVAALGSADPLERDEALVVLPRLRGPAPAAVPILQPLLTSDNPTTALRAALGLWVAEGNGKSAAPALVGRLGQFTPDQEA